MEKVGKEGVITVSVRICSFLVGCFVLVGFESTDYHCIVWICLVSTLCIRLI